MKTSRIAASVLILLALSFTVGCTKSKRMPTEYVEGLVTLDGAPVEGATVTFTPFDRETAEAASGFTDAKGMYRLTSGNGAPGAGALPGDYLVSVTKGVHVPVSKPTTDDYGNPITHETKNALPASYARGKSSGLDANVKPGRNRIDIKLESKKK